MQTDPFVTRLIPPSENVEWPNHGQHPITTHPARNERQTALPLIPMPVQTLQLRARDALHPV